MATKEEANKKDEETESDDNDPPPGEGLSDEVFEVEKIIQHVIDDDGILFFMVRWKNYGPDDDSWEPADNLGSAGSAIQAYWDSVKSTPAAMRGKSGRRKSSTPRTKSTNSSRKVKPSREEGQQKKEREKKKTLSPEPQEVEEESDHVKSDDEDYDGEKPKKLKPMSKGAMKAYDSPTKTKEKNDLPMSIARKKALELRNKSWLYDGSESDSDDDEKKSEMKKEQGTPPPKVEEVVQKEPDVETPSRKKEKKIKVNPVVEEETIPKSSSGRRSRDKKIQEEEDDDDEPLAKKSKIRPPTPPKPSDSEDRNRTSPPPPVIQYIESEDKKISLKIKLPPPPNGVKKSSIAKKEHKPSSEIRYYNKFEKYKPLSNAQELKEIDQVEGVMVNTKGGWNVMVRDVNGTYCVLTAEEAYERCGWTLCQYLLSRCIFA